MSEIKEKEVHRKISERNHLLFLYFPEGATCKELWTKCYSGDSYLRMRDGRTGNEGGVDAWVDA